MIAIIDYGMGNLNSVAKAFAHVAPDAEIRITDDAAVIDAATHIVLPGQSAMPDTMAALNVSGLRDATMQAAQSGRPFLGVCLGLQMLFAHSEEGDTPALGLAPGRVVRFARSLHTEAGEILKVPHMGWNAVDIPAAQIAHPLWAGIASGSAFYFAHSYFCIPENTHDVAGTANYPAPFCVAYGQRNVFAVQFHPEKSSAAGLQLLKNFTLWNPSSF